MLAYSLDVDGKKLSFRKSGSGPPIILLHASPMSSASLSSLMEPLASHFTVIAPDTPGYGHSDNPDTAPNDISYYSEVMHHFIISLNIKQTAIYGTATGAQIAIRLGLEHPDQVSHLFLDNTAHFHPEERQSILETYFPDFTPQIDGSHFSKIWRTVDRLFKYFPWNSSLESDKLGLPPMPSFVLDGVMKEYIRSGETYDWAYRNAFKHEDIAHVLKLKVPTIIFRWQASIIKKYNDRLFEGELPNNIKGAIIEKTEDRYKAMVKIIYDNSMLNKLEAVHLDGFQLLEADTPDYDFPLFPAFKSDGSHWLEAWKMMDEIVDEPKHLKDLNIKTMILLKWADA